MKPATKAETIKRLRILKEKERRFALVREIIEGRSLRLTVHSRMPELDRYANAPYLPLGAVLPMDLIVAEHTREPVQWPFQHRADQPKGVKFVKVYKGPGYPIDPQKELEREARRFPLPVLNW